MNFILFLKGLAMGAVNKIPGVSGGTVAFVTGIYVDLINSIKKYKFIFTVHLKSFVYSSPSRRFSQALISSEFESDPS